LLDVAFMLYFLFLLFSYIVFNLSVIFDE